MKLHLLAAACVGLSLLSVPVQAADWQLVGSWRLNVTCRDFTQVNTVSISEATARRVLGTTNVGDAFGKITGGKFDGTAVVFSNKYKWDGRNYVETWSGKLSRNGNTLSGAFTTTNAQAGGCKFRGSRM